MKENQIRIEIREILKEKGQISMAELKSELSKKGIIVNNLAMMQVLGTMDKLEKKIT